jgi:hypothetical protein
LEHAETSALASTRGRRKAGPKFALSFPDQRAHAWHARPVLYLVSDTTYSPILGAFVDWHFSRTPFAR